MTYRTNEQIEAGESEHLRHIRELCTSKIASNDDTNALQFARDVLNYLGPAPAAFVDPTTTAPSATGR